MKILAIDTTSRVGSVALLRDGTSGSERLFSPLRGHGGTLLEELDTLLREAGATLADIDLFVACSGPGSFTGLRVGLATARALAWARGRPSTGIGSLEALAAAGAVGGIVSPVIDARKSEVYAAAYRCTVGLGGEPGWPETVLEPAVVSPAAWTARIAELGLAEPIRFVGSGVEAYPEHFGPQVEAVQIRASVLGKLAFLLTRRAGGADALPPAAPRYVRPSEAEVKFGQAPAHDPMDNLTSS